MKDDKKIFGKLLLQYIKPHIKEQSLTLICIILGSIVSLQYPLIINIIVDDVLLNQNIGMLFTMLMVYIFLFLLGFMFSFLTDFMNNMNTQYFSLNLKKSMFNHLQNAPVNVINKISMGEINSTFNRDIDTISRFLSVDFLTILTNIFNIIVAMTIMILLNFKLAMMVAIVLPFYLVSVLLTGGWIKKSMEERRNLVTTVNQLLQDVFYNIKMIKLFIAQRLFFKKYLIMQDQVINTEIRTAVLTNILFQVSGMVFLAGNVIIIWFGSLLVFQGQLTIGNLMAFYTYIPLLFNPIRSLVASTVQFKGFNVSLNRISKYLVIDPEPNVKSKFKITKGTIEFRDVSFAYEEKPCLQNINLKIQAGEKVAFIGKNGSGKTTVVNLLLKLYKVNQGTILVDNVDITKISTNYLRREIGIVTQEVHFFNLSIKENLTLANSKCSELELMKACQLTGADEFIMQLPEGLNTIIGQKGYNFSGGQLQKMAISRLIAKNPPIVVFDEATSALDPDSTQAFYKLFDSAFKERTVLFILHDLKNLIYADRVIILKDGTIAREFSKDEIAKEHNLLSLLSREIA